MYGIYVFIVCALVPLCFKFYFIFEIYTAEVAVIPSHLMINNFMNPYFSLALRQGEKNKKKAHRIQTCIIHTKQTITMLARKAYFNRNIVMSMNSSIYWWFIWGFLTADHHTVLNSKRKSRTFIYKCACVHFCARTFSLFAFQFTNDSTSIHNFSLD